MSPKVGSEKKRIFRKHYLGGYELPTAVTVDVRVNGM
jgi:hypothetical protein